MPLLSIINFLSQLASQVLYYYSMCYINLIIYSRINRCTRYEIQRLQLLQIRELSHYLNNVVNTLFQKAQYKWACVRCKTREKAKEREDSLDAVTDAGNRPCTWQDEKQLGEIANINIREHNQATIEPWQIVLPPRNYTYYAILSFSFPRT